MHLHRAGGGGGVVGACQRVGQQQPCRGQVRAQGQGKAQEGNAQQRGLGLGERAGQGQIRLGHAIRGGVDHGLVQLRLHPRQGNGKVGMGGDQRGQLHHGQSILALARIPARQYLRQAQIGLAAVHRAVKLRGVLGVARGIGDQRRVQHIDSAEIAIVEIGAKLVQRRLLIALAEVAPRQSAAA